MCWPDQTKVDDHGDGGFALNGTFSRVIHYPLKGHISFAEW